MVPNCRGDSLAWSKAYVGWALQPITDISGSLLRLTRISTKTYLNVEQKCAASHFEAGITDSAVVQTKSLNNYRLL